MTAPPGEAEGFDITMSLTPHVPGKPDGRAPFTRIRKAA
jgi:hypothetical protein